MEANTISLALVALMSSLLTVMVSKGFDFLFAKQTFKRNLKQQFFTKKLEAAEKATKYYVSSIDYFKILQNSFLLLINDEKVRYSNILSKETIDKCMSVRDSAYEQVTTSSLYFNIKNHSEYPIDNEAKIRDYFSDIFRINENSNVISKEVKSILTEIVKCFNYEIVNLNHHAEVIRDNLKKYDM